MKAIPLIIAKTFQIAENFSNYLAILLNQLEIQMKNHLLIN